MDKPPREFWVRPESHTAPWGACSSQPTIGGIKVIEYSALVQARAEINFLKAAVRELREARDKAKSAGLTCADCGALLARW